MSRTGWFLWWSGVGLAVVGHAQNTYRDHLSPWGHTVHRATALLIVAVTLVVWGIIIRNEYRDAQKRYLDRLEDDREYRKRVAEFEAGREKNAEREAGEAN